MVKIKTLFNFLLNKKYKWDVESADVCIFDEAGSNFIVGALIDLNYYILNTRDCLYIKQLLQLANSFFKFGVGDLYYRYLCCTIKAINPKLVITYIDNSSYFWKLDKKFGNTIKFLAIQNGNRYFARDITYPDYLNHFFYKKNDYVYHSNFACISDYEKDLYSNSHAVVANFFSIGSLSLSEHIKNYVKRKKIFDLCLIANSTNERPVNIRIMQYLSKYVERYNVSACIALKRNHYSENYDKYMEIFDKFFGDSTVLLIPSKNVHVPDYALEARSKVSHPVHSSSYLSDVSEVTIGFASTMLRQSFSRGNKVYPINFEVEDAGAPFNIYDINLSPTYDEFEKYLNDLLIENEEDYCSKNKELMEYMDVFDLKDPPVDKLRKIILDLMG